MVPSWQKPQDQTNPQSPSPGWVSKAGSQQLAESSGSKSSLVMDCTWSIYRFKEKELGTNFLQQNKCPHQQVTLASSSLEKWWSGLSQENIQNCSRRKRRSGQGTPVRGHHNNLGWQFSECTHLLLEVWFPGPRLRPMESESTARSLEYLCSYRSYSRLFLCNKYLGEAMELFRNADSLYLTCAWWLRNHM